MMRPVLLGMNNPGSDRPEHALYPYPPNCTGARLLRFSGLTRAEYLDGFERRNVISGEPWSPRRARELAPALRAELLGGTASV